MSDLISVIEAQFFYTLEVHNIRMKYREPLVMNGKIHRFSTAEDKRGEKSGGYYIHSDGWPNWGFIDYRKSENDTMIKYKLDPKITPKYILDFLNSSYQNSYQTQIKDTKKNISIAEREEARKRAYDEYSRAIPNIADLHPYCILKKISGLNKNIKVVQISHTNDITQNGDLIIPLVNIHTRKFQSLQRITKNKMSNGKHMKGIYPNTILRDACYIFQEINRPRKIIICEGFATGASIFSTCRDRAVVISAMTCHNMKNIAQAVEKYKIPLVIAGDNDEAGIKTCDEISRLILGSQILFPPKSVNDWNDYISQIEC